MDEEIDRLVVSVRADTTGLQRDVAALRGSLEGPLGQGADAAGRAIENALVRATRSGRLGFEDLKKVALSALSDIASGAIRGGIGSILSGSGVGGAAGGILSTIGSIFGAPGRATGGPVSPGRAYLIGERGPELFVPTTSGQIAAAAPNGDRGVQVAITINAARGEAPQALAQSSRQVARAVRAAIDGAAR